MASSTLEETVRTEQEEFEKEKTGDPLPDGEERRQVGPTLAPGETGTLVNDDPDAEPGQPLEDATGQTAILDRSQYEREDLAIAKVDGQAIDRIRIVFSGTVTLDRSEPADVALYNRLTLGKGGLTLMVEGKCAGTGAKEATSQDGDLDVIVGVKTVKIDSVYIPAAEDIADELESTRAA